MKVPKVIKKAILESAKHNQIAKEYNEVVRQWLYKNKLYNDGVLDQLIDSIEIGFDPQGFLDYIENKPAKGNTEEYNGSFDDGE